MRLPIYATAILASASLGTACLAKEQSFNKRSARIRVPCEITRDTQVEYHAPPGWKIVSADAAWVGLAGVEKHTENIQANSREKPTIVFATGTITGRPRGVGIEVFGRRIARCAGIGYGWLQLAGTISRQ